VQPQNGDAGLFLHRVDDARHHDGFESHGRRYGGAKFQEGPSIDAMPLEDVVSGRPEWAVLRTLVGRKGGERRMECGTHGDPYGKSQYLSLLPRAESPSLGS
jgi:hypothetical protein